ncbi:MAG: TetR/AcrR family transcriptional regulator [Pseudomonadota bacterium]
MDDLHGLNIEKRALILDAAIAEFLDKGFSDARMDAISARATVSKRTVYKHFQSKESLFHAIVDLLAEQIAETLDLTYDPARPIRDQLVELGWAEGRLFLSERAIAMFRMIFAEAMRDPDLAAGLQTKFDKTKPIAALLRAADLDGKLRVDAPEAAAEQFIAMLKARAFWPAIFGAPQISESEMADVIETSVAMLMARYGVDA